MEFRRTRHILGAALLLCAFAPAFAQGSVGGADSGYSPYSIFGIGDILDKGISYNAAMGGVGIADRNERVLNILNPAAVTAREEKSFMFDFGLNNSNTIFEGNAATALGKEAEGPHKSAMNTFTMHHVAASFPIYKHSAFKLGIQPYSAVGYNFIAHEVDDALVSEVGNINYQKYGEGTLYQVFLGAGVTLWDRLSLGVDGQYYFGNIIRHSAAYFNTNAAYRTISTGWDYVMSGFSAKFGLQYEQPIGNTSKLRVGATFNLGTKIKGYEKRYAFAEFLSATDSILFQVNNIEGHSIPAELGVAIGFSASDAWRFNFDYTRQDWTGIPFSATPGVDFKPCAAQSFRFGLEYTPNRYDIRYYMRRVSYRAGVYRKGNYVSLNGHQVTATGFTFGASFPVFRYYNAISFGVDIGQRGTMKDDLIRERYVMFNVSFDIHDIWFIKNLYN